VIELSNEPDVRSYRIRLSDWLHRKAHSGAGRGRRSRHSTLRFRCIESWLVAGIVPGVEHLPLKKLAADENGLLKLLERWRAEAEKAGHKIDRMTVAFEAGRDGFWLARWLRARGIDAHVIHAASVAVPREHRRAKTDRLDTEHLKRAFLGWLRGEREHCKMCAIPTFAEEDAKRPHRERETLVGEHTTIINRIKGTLARLGVRSFNPKLKKAPERLEHLRTPEGEPIPPNTLAELQRDLARKQLVAEQIREIEKARLEQLNPKARPNLMVLVLMRVIGIGIETADMLVKEILSRNLRDRRAVARYGGLTGSPDESGKTRREKGLARAGNARVRRGMIQLAWRFLDYIEGCGTNVRAPHAGSPRLRHPDHSKCAAVLEAVKDEPSVGADAPILDRFSARRLRIRAGRDEETGAPGRTKKQRAKKMNRTLGAPP